MAPRDHSVELDIPRKSFGILCGSKGLTKTGHEFRLGVRIDIPNRGRGGKAKCVGDRILCKAAKADLEAQYGVASDNESWSAEAPSRRCGNRAPSSRSSSSSSSSSTSSCRDRRRSRRKEQRGRQRRRSTSYSSRTSSSSDSRPPRRRERDYRR
eukprot:TRINITY_DN8881_c2_g2_i1.p1 TRINITY_DN8881_c2_g2~~TRINITY_DN8881_c2_g2_i1.p1  ORF type:complete len:164 (+),score=17.38 TRINITY_DN8881_c2_g2_i1:31-492(+)